MTPEAFRAVLLQAGFGEPVPVERDGQYRLDRHTHDFEAFALVTDGEIMIEVEGVATTYRAGEVFRLAARTPHREAAGPQGVRYLAGRKAVA